MTAPARAAVGQTITVHAQGLIPATGYSLVLDGGTPPSKNDFCIGLLATSHRSSRSLTFTVRIPRTVTCWSGYPPDRAGSTRVTQGAYLLQLQQGQITPEGGFSFVKRKITITG